MTIAGTVYLLHFDRPYKHARHYIGWTLGDLNRRLDQHRKGTGARLMQVVTAAGIDFALARVWDGGRNLERSLKNRGGASRACPLCGITPRVTGWTLPADEHTVTEDLMPFSLDLASATCGCDRVTSIAAPLLASASITCGDCRQPLIPYIHDVQEERHELAV